MTISQRIFFELEQQGKKQREMAEYTGIPTSTISAWNKKNTNPSAESLSIIADFLEVSLEYLVTGKEKSSFTELSEDEQRLLNMYNLLDDMGKGEILGELKIMTHYRADKDQQVRIAARSVGSYEPLKIPENLDILDSIPTMKEE